LDAWINSWFRKRYGTKDPFRHCTNTSVVPYLIHRPRIRPEWHIMIARLEAIS